MHDRLRKKQRNLMKITVEFKGYPPKEYCFAGEEDIFEFIFSHPNKGDLGLIRAVNSRFENANSN